MLNHKIFRTINITLIVFTSTLIHIPIANADEAPQPIWDGTGNGSDALFFQTTGHSSNCNDGNWLTCTSGINGDHFYEIIIPCDWPTDKDFHIDLFSPWYTSSDEGAGGNCNQATSNSVCNIDEDLKNNELTSEFHLYSPNTFNVDLFANPQLETTSSTINSTAYPEVSIDHEWVRFTTISAPATCGSYLLHEEITWSHHARNGWSIRTGYDDDNDPTNAPPADFANPNDATSGTPIGFIGIEPEFGGPRESTPMGDKCLGFSFNSAPASIQPTFSFYAFDIDYTSSITYEAPDGVQYITDPQNASGWNGSGNIDTTDMATVLAAVWDGVGDKPEIGDHFLNPTDGGTWHITMCISNEDHYFVSGPFENFEASPIENPPLYPIEPFEPTTPTSVSLSTPNVSSNNNSIFWQLEVLILLFTTGLCFLYLASSATKRKGAKL